MTARAYPLPDPGPGGDPRFSFTLIHDLLKLLEAHDYPMVADPVDQADLQRMLYAFLYGDAGLDAATVDAIRAYQERCNAPTPASDCVMEPEKKPWIGAIVTIAVGTAFWIGIAIGFGWWH